MDMSLKVDARWLDQEQQKIWRNYLLGSARITAYLDEDLRKFNLDLSEYEILVALSEAPNRQLRMSALAALVHQSRSRLTHAVSRLEKDGYVIRTACPQDRRGVLAELTVEGYSMLELAAPSHVEAVRRIFVDVVDPADYAAIGRAMIAVLNVQD